MAGLLVTMHGSTTLEGTAAEDPLRCRQVQSATTGVPLVRIVRAGRRTAIVGVTLSDLGIIMDALVAVDALDEQAARDNSDRRGLVARLLGGPDPEVRDYFRGKNDRLRRQIAAAIKAIDDGENGRVGG